MIFLFRTIKEPKPIDLYILKSNIVIIVTRTNGTIGTVQCDKKEGGCITDRINSKVKLPECLKEN